MLFHNIAEKSSGSAHEVRPHGADHQTDSRSNSPIGNAQDGQPVETDFSPQEQQDILRRLRNRLPLVLAPLISVAIVDRTNVSLAAVGGMREDLDLDVGSRYSLINLVFFLSYLVFDLPSTMVIRQVGAPRFLGSIIFTWGAVMIGFGFVKQWGSLLVLRVLLGALEAGIIPCTSYLLSTWYPRYEQGRQFAVLNLVSVLLTSLGGILAYGFTQMDGLAGLRGWRWIFLLEGTMTCVAGIVGFCLLVDFPDAKRSEWRFLAPKERAWVIRRVEDDRGDIVARPFSLARYMRGAMNVQIWACGLIYYTATTIVYGFAFSLPLILHQSLGYSVGASQCLITPPALLSALVIWAEGYLGDRYHTRGPLIMINAVLCIVGLSILGWHADPKVRYFGVFLAAVGAHGTLPLATAYQANNIRGQWKRAAGNAVITLFAGLAGITGATVFRPQDARTGYKMGYWACLGAAVAMFVTTLCLMMYFRRENALADSGKKQLECDEDRPQASFRYTL